MSDGDCQEVALERRGEANNMHNRSHFTRIQDLQDIVAQIRAGKGCLGSEFEVSYQENHVCI